MFSLAIASKFGGMKHVPRDDVFESHSLGQASKHESWCEDSEYNLLDNEADELKLQNI